MFNELMSEVIVCFVDIDEIVDHHCLTLNNIKEVKKKLRFRECYAMK
jgi:hypothetical protein